MALPVKVVRATFRNSLTSLNDTASRKGTTWCRLSFNILQSKLFSSTASPKFVSDVKKNGKGQRSEGQKDIQERLKKEYYEECVPNLYSRDIDMTLDKLALKLNMVPDQPESPKRLKLAIIGPPNSGKSTLTNQLAKWKVSSVSEKIHTTRSNVVSVHTEGDLQIVMKDTPGVARPKMQRRKILEPLLISSPKTALTDADLICVIVDGTDKLDCQGLDKGIQILLENYRHVPSFLIINKVDIVKKKEDLLSVVQVLTNGIVGGISLRSGRKMLSDRKLKKEQMFDQMDLKYKKSFGQQSSKVSMDYDVTDCIDVDVSDDDVTDGIDVDVSDDDVTDGSDVDVSDGDDITATNHVESGKHSFIYGDGIFRDDEIPSETAQRDKTKDAKAMNRKKLTLYTGESLSIKKHKNVKGWSHFDRVFMTTALYEKGVEPIREYLAERAQPGDWSYHSSVVTDENPMQLACQCVWSAILELCHNEVPYKVYPHIVDWKQDDNQEILKIAMEINTDSVRNHAMLLGQKGATHEKILDLATQKLMDLFRYQTSLKLRVILKRKKDKI